MNKTRHTNRLRMIALLGVVLTAIILFAGCGKAPQDEKTSAREVAAKAAAKTVIPVKTPEKQAAQGVTTQPAKTPAAAKAQEKPAPQAATAQPAKPPEAEDSSSIVEGIGACKDLIELHEKVEELKKPGALSPDVSAEIDEKHKALLDKARVFHYTDKLDLLAVDLRMIGPDKARLYLLFRPNAQLTSDYKVGVMAVVDKSHAKYLSADADEKNLAEKFTFWPPSSRKWAPGEEVLITTEANLKPIPYRLYVGLYANEPPHRLGENQELGWYADLE